jgi:hypothetical protein
MKLKIKEEIHRCFVKCLSLTPEEHDKLLSVLSECLERPAGGLGKIQFLEIHTDKGFGASMEVEIE